MFRFLTYLFVTLSLMPVQIVAICLRGDLARRLPGFYHRLCTWILGIDVHVAGQRVADRPALFVGNHTSYLDITILGGLIDGSFVAKAEVARWPLYGWLAKMQRTVFVERRASHSARQKDEISDRLAAGDRLILFPEGTSDDGNRVLPFKSALFAVAEQHPDDTPLTVQPFSIAYTRLDDLPIGREWRPMFAWYGDMEMLPHVWRIFTFARLRVDVWFHEAVNMDRFKSRKEMADYCHGVVAEGLAGANMRGAPQTLPETRPETPPEIPPEAE